MELEFKNLISSKTGETVKVEVPDDFDMVPMEEWGRQARESSRKITEAFSKDRMEEALASPRVEMPPGLSRDEKRKLILESFGTKMVENQEDLDAAFAADIDEHYWELF